MQLNEVQASIAKKIKPTHKKFVPICTGYNKALTKKKYAGLMYFLEAQGMGKDAETALEEPKEEKAKITWEEDNQATTNVITNAPVDLNEWRTSKPEWVNARKLLDVFLDGASIDYEKLFTSEHAWRDRKTAYAGKFNLPELEVTDKLLTEKRSESAKSVKDGLTTKVMNWKKNPHNKAVKDEIALVHYRDIIADILYMKGRKKDQGDKWQMLYEHGDLKDLIECADTCAPFIGFDGDNFEHVMIAFDKTIKDVSDGIFEKKQKKDPRDTDSSSPDISVRIESQPIDIQKKSAPPSPKKRNQYSPPNKHYSPPVVIDPMEKALEMFLNSNAGVEVALKAADDAGFAHRSTEAMTNSIASILRSQPARKTSPEASPVRVVPSVLGFTTKSIVSVVQESPKESPKELSKELPIVVLPTPVRRELFPESSESTSSSTDSRKENIHSYSAPTTPTSLLKNSVFSSPPPSPQIITRSQSQSQLLSPHVSSQAAVLPTVTPPPTGSSGSGITRSSGSG